MIHGKIEIKQRIANVSLQKHRFIRTRLSIMMFLQFFIWGAWYTTIAVYMRNNGMESLTHWPYTVNPIAAIVAPFFLGLVADRYFATEKVLVTLHLLGGVIMLSIPQTSGQPLLFVLMLLLYNLCYMPTLGLVNSLAFHHIDQQEKQFPFIRVYGTIGWIAAGLFVSFVLSQFASSLLPEQTALPLYCTGVASILLGLYSFTLPHTPPAGKSEGESISGILGLDALKKLGNYSFYIFIISSLLICIPLAAYYNFTQIFLEAADFRNIAATQTLGQGSEVLFMLLMPLFFARLGVKWMLLVGMAAWVLRYLLFSFAAVDNIIWMIIAGILLHGICYDFFFVTGQIYVDKKSSPEVRGQAQGLLVLITYGVGMLLGAQVAGHLYNALLEGKEVLSMAQFRQFWLFPAFFAAGVLLFFGLCFREVRNKSSG